MNDEHKHDAEEYAHHTDNLRRFVALEKKIDDNTAVTSKLSDDVADLLTMWRDAGVVFKWLRTLGAALVWISKIIAACAALWAAWRYGIQNGPK